MVVGIRSNFKIGSEKTLPFRYLGLEFREKQGITVDQTNYLEKIQQIRFSGAGGLLSKNEDKNSMRTSLGKLLWLSTQTQPGLSFCTSTMASKIRAFKKSDLAVLNKLIRKCKAMPAKLCF